MHFVTIPGAGGAGYAWSLVAERLRASGHTVATPDLPTGEHRGLSDYADAIADAAGDASETTLVAHSLGGFTAALAARRIPVARLVFLTGMIPVPGESAGDWWDAVGFADERAKAERAAGRDPDAEFDLGIVFFHDVPDDRRATIESIQLPPDAEEAFTEPAGFSAWPSVPIRVLVGRDDRFLPAEFQRRVALERLPAGTEIVEVPGGHMAALAAPDEVAAAILAT
jgi:pimeloyl-ACP methyl ester carboxylesterase